MKFLYDKERKIALCINKLIPVKGYTFMNLCGVLFTRIEDYAQRLTAKTLRHEKTHTFQILELGVIFFYILYGLEYLLKLPFYMNLHDTYRNLSFEREARFAESEVDYFENRKVFQYKWVKRIWR